MTEEPVALEDIHTELTHMMEMLDHLKTREVFLREEWDSLVQNAQQIQQIPGPDTFRMNMRKTDHEQYTAIVMAIVNARRHVSDLYMNLMKASLAESDELQDAAAEVAEDVAREQMPNFFARPGR